VVEHLVHILNDVVLNDRVLLLSPPLGDLREALLAEVLVENPVIPPVGRKEREEVLDGAALESRGEVIHGLLSEVGAEDHRQHSDSEIW